MLLKQMNHLGAPEDACKSGLMGVNWASSGGESAALLKDKYLAADGIENVIKVLEEIEDEKLDRLDFVELNACSGGCVGGSLTAETRMSQRRGSSSSEDICPLRRIIWRATKCPRL